MDNETDQTDIQEAGQHHPFDNDETIGKIYSMGNPLARLLFRDFPGLASGDKVPDGKTIRAFKEVTCPK